MRTARSDQARRRVSRARQAAIGLLLRERGDPGALACWQALDAITPSPLHLPGQPRTLAAPAHTHGHSVALTRLAVALIVVGLLAGVVTLAAGLVAGALSVALPAAVATIVAALALPPLFRRLG